MQIVIKKVQGVWPVGKGSELTLDHVEKTWTVRRLKEAIEATEGIAAATQFLCFQNPDGNRLEMRGRRELGAFEY